MKILILIEKASLGGHQLSALTTGKELQNRGHKVSFAGGKGTLTDKIKKWFPFYEIPFYFYHGPRETYFTWKSLITLRKLAKLTQEKTFDLIHAFDSRSYIVASILSIIRKIPITCTICGGIAPYYNIPHSAKLIVFSEEQKRKLINIFGWKGKNIEVIKSRLDMEQFKNISDTEVFNLCQKYNINPSARNIMMITTFLGPKIEAIKHVLRAMQIVLPQFSDVNLVMIGGRGGFFKEAQKIGERINQSCGRKAIIFTGPVINAHRLLPASFIVIGIGRSAFEGMAYQKPTLIVGEKGFAGTVNQTNINEISFYNFSGRNNKKLVPPEILAQEIIKLLTNKQYYESVRYFGKEFLKKEIDIKAGISKIENIYKININYIKNNTSKDRMFRIFNMTKVLTPIFIDNYYNQLKLSLLKLFSHS